MFHFKIVMNITRNKAAGACMLGTVSVLCRQLIPCKQRGLALLVHSLSIVLLMSFFSLRVYGEDDSLISVDDIEEINDECSVESTRPVKNFSCAVQVWLRFAWQKMRLILLGEPNYVA